jgi:1-deoxyxylulose-5-phosphate synthase
MKFVKFGSTGLTVSRVCMGTATFGKQTDENTAQQILDKVADAGVNFIDTADMYPIGADLSLAGRTEEITGRWLKTRRNRFIVATKGGGPMGPSSWDQGASRKHLIEAIDASLRRLGTDYVDLYQLHIDDPSTPLDESLAALARMSHGGKRNRGGRRPRMDKTHLSSLRWFPERRSAASEGAEGGYLSIFAYGKA